jgi:hypothetical protein
MGGAKKSPGIGRGVQALSLSYEKAPAQGGKAGEAGLATDPAGNCIRVCVRRRRLAM